jgi:hypothetical protein
MEPRGDELRGSRFARDHALTSNPTVREVAYVLAVAGLAMWGFAADSTATILVAVAVALPAGAVALVGYYLAYGLLALVPGANPDVNSGSSCSSCPVTETGDVAMWLTLSTDVIAVLLLMVAAVANVILFRLLVSRR